MKITILGCGGSLGVPQINCKCYVCSSKNSKNIRTRSSILIESKSTKIVVDTSPDFRMQCLKNNISKIDALIYTHEHTDHVSGIDDVRPFQINNPVPAYMDKKTFNSVNKRFKYLLNTGEKLNFITIKPKTLLQNQVINDIKVSSFKQIHGTCYSKGLLFNNKVAYSTDFDEIPEKNLKKLYNIDVWIVDCLKYSFSKSHSYLEKTLLLIDIIKPKLSILTHMDHDIEYNEISKILPSNVEAAFDGMKLNIK